MLFSPTALGEALIGAYDRMGLKEVYECALQLIMSEDVWSVRLSQSLTGQNTMSHPVSHTQSHITRQSGVCVPTYCPICSLHGWES
jgi:hypothetical protein